MHRVRESGDDGAGCVIAVEVAIDATVVCLLPHDVSARVEFDEQRARRVFLRERTRGCATPVAGDEIATVGSLNAGERVLVAARRAAAVELEDKGAKVPIGAAHAPNGDVAAISRLSDLVDGAAIRSGRVGEGPD